MGGSGSGKMDEQAIVKLDGTVQNSDGTLTKTNLFEYLEIELDDYSDIEMTAPEAQRFMNHVRRMKTGVSAFLPKLCPGPNKCQLGDRCPFEGRYPLARGCPLEVSLIKERTRSYVESHNIDVGSPYEMSLVDRLVELDVFEYRANLALSNDHEDGPRLIRSEFIETKRGDLLESQIVHPLLEVKEKLHRKRMDILRALVASPQEKYKEAAATKKKDSGGFSSQLANLRSMIIKMTAADGIGDINEIIEDAKRVENESVTEADWEEITTSDDEE